MVLIKMIYCIYHCNITCTYIVTGYSIGTLLVQSVTHRCTWHTDIVCVQIYSIDVTYWPNGSGAIFVKFSFPNACAVVHYKYISLM